MKHILIISTLLFSVNFLIFGQSTKKTINHKHNIDFSLVDFIEIRQQSRGSDTFQINPIRMTKKQSKKFIDEWNKANPNGPCKNIAQHWVDIKLKDSTTRTFRINGENITENTDWCFTLVDSSFLSQIVSVAILKSGTYGMYLDWSTYIELVIKGNKKFEYIDRGFTGIGYKNFGKWKISNGNLILYDYKENNSISPMPTVWKINYKQLCNITKNHKRKSLCIEFKE